MTMDLHPPLPWVETVFAPLYVLTYPQSYTDEEVIASHRRIELWYATVDRPIAWVVDCSHVMNATPKQRKIVADHETRIRPYAERYNAGVGIVITHRLVRGLLTAVFWLAPPPFAYEIFAERSAARAWAQARLDRATSMRPEVKR